MTSLRLIYTADPIYYFAWLITLYCIYDMWWQVAWNSSFQARTGLVASCVTCGSNLSASGWPYLSADSRVSMYHAHGALNKLYFLQILSLVSLQK